MPAALAPLLVAAVLTDGPARLATTGARNVAVFVTVAVVLVVVGLALVLFTRRRPPGDDEPPSDDA